MPILREAFAEFPGSCSNSAKHFLNSASRSPNSAKRFLRKRFRSLDRSCFGL
ncbi:hypothetical protein [Leptospira noguchii]|uniref:hypothetical protein n=1 Tax=Leptospira noguchii TaxID=28182 RepID=UPI00034A4E30|nr:hypothetical protein [Leptospira noguchii]UOG49033.1 hypothetical protein MAL00_01495 [Leptospira noguchii]